MTSSFSLVKKVRSDQVGMFAIALFPKLATAITNLDLSLLLAGTYPVRVLDAVGRQVLATTGDGGTKLPPDLHAAANGTYLVLVRSAGGQLFTKRLVKE